MDPQSASRLEELRRRYFPAGRNFLAAHLTLFHALRPQHLASLESLCKGRAAPSVTLQFRRPRSIGRGVVIETESFELVRMHARMRTAFGAGLTAQDQQSLRPHVTIQNKVSPAQAAAALAEVSVSFAPWTGQGHALSVWRYLGGPWEPHAELPLPLDG